MDYSSSIFGDIDNDGDLDLVLSGCTSASTWTCTNSISKIYINNGSTLTENSAWQSNLTGMSSGSLVFGDINNDGNLDLALAGCSSGGGYAEQCSSYVAKIYINNGTTFTENQTWEQNLTGVNLEQGTLAFGDIDNDGNLDLALVGADSTTKNGIYINNGTAFVKNSTWLESLPLVGQGSGGGALAFGDVNNDGRLDLIFAGSLSTDFYTAVYINNGTSLVENSTWEENFLAYFGFPSLTVGDYDSDGDLDFGTIGSRVGDHFYIYENNGSTFIVKQQDPYGGGVFYGSLGWGDYDNDGDLDAIYNGREGYTFLFYYNGSEFIRDFNQSFLGLEFGSSINWIDIDNDGDLDILETGYDSSYEAKVYTSNCSLTKNNTQPNSSTTNFSGSYSNDQLTLSWGQGNDSETNITGLYYNLRVGTCSGCHNIVSDVYGGGEDNGYFGNMMQRKRIVLNRPDLENKTIYWAVQTIDTGLAKSAWSTEQVFNTTQAPPPCTENWTYGEWGSCVSGQQTRTATDSNSCGTSLNRSAIVQSCSTTPSGGSPSGSSPPPSAPSQNKSTMFGNVTWYFDRIEAGVETGFSINETGLAVHQVWVNVKNEATGVAIDVKKMPARPSFVQKEPEGKVYQYLNITKMNLSDSNVESGKIRFRVEKAWLKGNKINASSVVLSRYADNNNEWQKLKTEFRSEDSGSASYLAETPGFSIFAISGEVLKENGTICVPSEKKCVENRLEECSVDGSEWVSKEVCGYGCENGKCNEKSRESFEFSYAWIVIPVVIIAIVITGLYFLKRRGTYHKLALNPSS